jgi:glycosyltransferase involved in cell wall biosynthesis
LTNQIEISVVVPVFNSVETLEPLFQRTQSVMLSLEKSFELIFVLDGNNVKSWSELLSIQKKSEGNVRLFRLAKNYGQNSATICGINHSKGQVVITMDDDLQTPPEEIANLLEKYEQSNLDVVYGVPEVQKSSKFRRLGARIGKVWFKAIDGSDLGSSFRLIGPRIKNHLNSERQSLFINQVVNWYTNDIDTVEVKNAPRLTGKSGYSLLNLIMIMLRLIVFYTDFPLRLITGLGAFISVVCFGLGAFYVFEKFTIGAELGFTSIIVAIFFATGIILLALSVIGLYINRMYEYRSNKPVYSVKTEI